MASNVTVTDRLRPGSRLRVRRGARKPEAKVQGVEEAELISLEGADADGQDKKAPAEDTLTEDEEEDIDGSEIIGGDI